MANFNPPMGVAIHFMRTEDYDILLRAIEEAAHRSRCMGFTMYSRLREATVLDHIADSLRQQKQHFEKDNLDGQ